MAKADDPGHWSVLITCEHAGHQVPAAFLRRMSKSQQKDLLTHKGWDPGALAMARHAAVALEAPLLYTKISRLLVDCNRSPQHPRCLGPAFRDLDPAERNFIQAAWYWPHRNAIEAEILRILQSGSSVLHLAMHSFTPVLDGERRTAEVGLLYDPARPWEKMWSDALLKEMKSEWPTWRLRRNYPYLGTSDGLTTWLRRHYGPQEYVGIEIEWNQALFTRNLPDARMKRGLVRSLRNLFLHFS
ncbi:N-formylglutamate amidohydrolase [Oligoflexus tunisiensis]|uniref:N-formylglutamate amidohydrolase n=1 Tax=Oligoflexus tunisiensis TaxID=708132 RepID=UPI00114CF851|nr:N-formylglutamate amidohydrolase [Oligoflexus tunisiensis]